MKKIPVLLCCLLLLAGAPVLSQTHSKQFATTTNTQTMTTTNVSTVPVKAFFTAFGNGDFQGILNTFDNNCSITAVRAGARDSKQIYGTYQGKEGVKAFLSNLSAAFDTKAFAVEDIVGEGNIAFASGTFTHLIKSTGKLFFSKWALKCVIRDGKILEYQFYEDSAMFLEASAN
jgi:ketosteroid isomerase-like protein